MVGLAVAATILVAACGGGGGKAKAPRTSTTTRATVSTTVSSGIPATQANLDGAVATVRAFMDARVGDAGAEGYLDDDAKAQYIAQIKLYDVVSYTIGSPDGTDQRAITVPVTIQTHSGSTRTEVLTLKPGASNTVPPLPYKILSASVQ